MKISKIVVSVLWYAALLVLAYCLLTACSIFPQRQVHRPVPYTMAEMQSFWKTNIRPLVRYRYLRGETTIPEFDVRIRESLSTIEERHGKLSLGLSTNYTFFVPDLMDSYMSNTVAILEISIPQFLETYRRMSNTATYESYVLVHVMHETDRLAGGHVTIDRAGRENPWAIVRYETASWAYTAEHTIGLLVDTYHVELDPELCAIYDTWIISGRSTNSPIWTTFIRNRYMGKW